MSRLVFSFALVALLLPVVSFAQFATNEPLTVSINPANPRPYQTITVTPSSTLIDLISSTITVTVNGKVVEKGSGVQSVPVTVGGPGAVTTINVTASVGGQSYSKQLTIKPGDVSLIVEPSAPTHPFYKGASLPGSLGQVRIIALADLRSSPSTRIPPSSLVYTWKVGDKILTEQSGLGRSILSVTAPARYRDAQITVTVATANGLVGAEATTVLSPVDPIVRIYPNDPLLGPDFDHALSNSFSMSGEEETFRGVAYYFGAVPGLTWSVNGGTTGTDRDVTVRTTGTGEGTASLALSAVSDGTHQTANNTLSVHFGSKSTTNIFGF